MVSNRAVFKLNSILLRAVRSTEIIIASQCYYIVSSNLLLRGLLREFTVGSNDSDETR